MTEKPPEELNTGEDAGVAPAPRDLPEPPHPPAPTRADWEALAAKETKGRLQPRDRGQGFAPKTLYTQEDAVDPA